jgi:hypothetical protein
MWAFGRDATRAGGNLLIHRGFVRTAPAAGVPTSGTYRLVEEGLELELSSVRIPRKLITDSAVKLIGHSTGSRSPAPA